VSERLAAPASAHLVQVAFDGHEQHLGHGIVRGKAPRVLDTLPQLRVGSAERAQIGL
jgi:hypothetical protein